jgi:hypothetical protein
MNVTAVVTDVTDYVDALRLLVKLLLHGGYETYSVLPTVI